MSNKCLSNIARAAQSAAWCWHTVASLKNAHATAHHHNAAFQLLLFTGRQWAKSANVNFFFHRRKWLISFWKYFYFQTNSIWIKNNINFWIINKMPQQKFVCDFKMLFERTPKIEWILFRNNELKFSLILASKSSPSIHWEWMRVDLVCECLE